MAGKLEERYSYSPAVYNNFPWINLSELEKKKIKTMALAILEARNNYSNNSLAELYDELAMPVELRKAHQANDKAVMEAYGLKKTVNGKKTWLSESETVAKLFEMYEKNCKEVSGGKMIVRNPKVFISYSWEDENHRKWVKSLADRLLENGINASIDQYDLGLGDRLPQFMEQQISDSDFVLIICTHVYKEKANNRKSGVGYEGHIISAELLSGKNERKFIPIVKEGQASEMLPIFLAGKLGVDLSDGEHFEENFNDLLTTIFGVKKKPKIGEIPRQIKKSPLLPISQNENKDIEILGIVTDEVTVPKMDGSRGSALYKIPFRLNKRPNQLWKELFVRNWNSPPRFTTMHRSGIAQVIGEEIILDGTTIEEVRDYHRETLKLCVEKSNKEEKAILAQAELRKERENESIRVHEESIRNLADEIDF